MPSVFQTTGEGSISNSRLHDNREIQAANESNGAYYIYLLSESTLCLLFADEIQDFPQESDTAGLDTTQATTGAHTGNNTKTADTDDADTTDADLLELLVNNYNITTNTEQDRPVEAQSAVPPATPPVDSEPVSPVHPSQPDGGNSDTNTPLVVDHFPHGSPGAPIPGARQGSYQRSQEAFGASVWAPFHSQCDWEVARWAKMRGPTSSAMQDLLAIPGVHAL